MIAHYSTNQSFLEDNTSPSYFSHIFLHFFTYRVANNTSARFLRFALNFAWLSALIDSSTAAERLTRGIVDLNGKNAQSTRKKGENKLFVPRSNSRSRNNKEITRRNDFAAVLQRDWERWRLSYCINIFIEVKREEHKMSAAAAFKGSFDCFERRISTRK